MGGNSLSKKQGLTLLSVKEKMKSSGWLLAEKHFSIGKP